MRFILIALTSLSLFAADERIEPHKSFVREVLQPFGMPVVSTFHNIKGNHFLNIHRINATGLEALGDFFLTPSRYLFGGQDVIVKDNTLQAHPSFRYRHLDGLKTALSMIALPVSQLLGSTFKAAAWLSPETREHYRAIRHSLEGHPFISHLEEYAQKGIPILHTEERAPCLDFKRPSILSPIHQLELEAFKKITQLFDENGIVYWLDCGSCLGAYRYGGMIPWDDDIDISILGRDHDNVKLLLSQLDPNEFQIQDWSSYRYPKTFLKLYIKKTRTLIDIYHYDLDENTQTATYFYSYKDSALPDSWKKFELVMTKPLPYPVVFPLKRAYLDGIPTWVPNQIVPYLQSKYGENLSPTMVWDEASQSYLKVKDHPYWQLFN